jgi:hypothetical protein
MHLIPQDGTVTNLQDERISFGLFECKSVRSARCCKG